MTTSFPRLLSTASNPTLRRTGSDHLTRSVSNSVTRLLCSSSSTQQHHHNNPVSEQPQAPPQSLGDENKQSQKEEKEVEEEDELDLNKETGEVGGPRGPEPPGTAIGNAMVAAMIFEILIHLPWHK